MAYTYAHEISNMLSAHYSTQGHYDFTSYGFVPSCYSAEHHMR